MADGIDKETESATGSTTSPAVGLVGTVISRRRRMSLRRVAIVTAALLFLTAAGLLFWAFDKQHVEKSRQAAVEKQEVVATEARQAIDLQQYDKAALTLEEQRKALDPVKDRKAYADTTLSLAKSLVGDKKYDEAIRLYKELQTDKEYEVDAKRGLGQAYLAKGDKEQARTYFQEVVTIVRTKQDPESQFRLTMDEAQLNAVSQ